jgi:hypothetical protein
MSQAEKPLVVFAVLAALAAVPAAAQSTDRDAAFNADLSAVQATVSQDQGALPKTMGAASQRAALAAAAAPAQASSCPDAKELETSFVLKVGSREMSFAYAGCRQEERNDYQAPYTERSYKGPDGYGLSIVTSDGWEPGHNYDGASSEVLISKGQDWVGRIGEVANAQLVSGVAVDAGVVKVSGAAGAQAYLRAADGVFAQTRVCDAGIAKLAGSSPRNSQDKVATGFGPGPSLVLLTDSQAYYYHEDCDICTELDACDLKTGSTRAAIVAHSVSCSDMDPYRQERGEVFSSCSTSPR